MFATPKLLDRRSKPERVADQAWQHLLSTVESAGESLKGSRPLRPAQHRRPRRRRRRRGGVA